MAHFVWLHERCFLSLLSLCSGFDWGPGFLTCTLRRGSGAWKELNSGSWWSMPSPQPGIQWSTVVVHSQMLDPLVGRKGVQSQICPENSECKEIDSNTLELSPLGQMVKTALCRLRRVSTEMLRIHICPPLSGRRSLPTKMRRWTSGLNHRGAYCHCCMGGILVL